jgi:hypothetical protein
MTQATKPPTVAADVSNPGSRWRKEVVLAISCIAVGLLVLPALIYMVGGPILGAYGGGPHIGSFYGDFVRNLGTGVVRTWFIVLAPYLFVSLMRLIFWPWGRKLPDNQPGPSGPSAKPAQSRVAGTSTRERREPFVAP